MRSVSVHRGFGNTLNIARIVREKIAPLLKAKDSPERVALAVAIGLFVGFTPTVGVQMAIVIFIATIPKVRFNVPIACAMVWISNPLTMIPLYYGMYWLGVLIMGLNGMGFSDFGEIMQGFITSIKEGENFIDSLWQGLTGIFGIGLDIGTPMWVGGTVIGLVVAIPAYLISLRLHRRRMRKRREKQARSARRSAEG